MYGVAGDKATYLDQIGRFLFNFGNPTYGGRTTSNDVCNQGRGYREMEQTEKGGC